MLWLAKRTEAYLKTCPKKGRETSYKINLKGIDTFMNNISVTPLNENPTNSKRARGCCVYVFVSLK